MKKFILFFSISLLFSNLTLSQDWKSEYDKKVIEANQFDIQLKEKQKELDKLVAEKKALEKDTAEYKKFKPDYDKLLVENIQLRGMNSTLTNDNAQLKSEKQGLSSGNIQLKSEKQGLSEENARIKQENADLLTQLSSYKSNDQSRNSEIERLKSEKGTIVSDYEKCKSTNATLKSNNEQLDEELKQLTGRVTQLETDKQALTTKIYQLNSDNQAFSKENVTLKDLLLNTIKSSVNYATSSNQYDPGKSEELISTLERASAFYKTTEISNLISKINQFKELCAAIAEAKRVLDKPYDKGTADMALNTLAKSPTFNPVHVNDIAKYKKLIQEYCTKSDYCAKHMVTVKKFQLDYPVEAKKELDATMDNIDEKYTYLLKELKAKKQNLRSYNCNFPTNCN